MSIHPLDTVRRHLGLSDKQLGKLSRLSESAASLIVRSKRNPQSPGGRRMMRTLLAAYRKLHPGEVPGRVGSRQLASALHTIAARIALDNVTHIISEHAAV